MTLTQDLYLIKGPQTLDRKKYRDIDYKDDVMKGTSIKFQPSGDPLWTVKISHLTPEHQFIHVNVRRTSALLFSSLHFPTPSNAAGSSAAPWVGGRAGNDEKHEVLVSQDPCPFHLTAAAYADPHV